MPAPRPIVLLSALAGAAALYVWSRTRAGSAAVVDATGASLDFIDVSASRIGATLGSRGYRNRNPGNIRFIVRNPWNGQVADDGGYGVYDTAANGTRALGKELLKRARDGFHSVRDLIAGKVVNGQRQGGWAPSIENNTEAYVRDVAHQLGVDADAPIDIESFLPQLARAIARHENGYLDSDYNFDSWVYL